MPYRKLIRAALIAVCVLVLVWSASQLISYAADALRTQRINRELSAAYHPDTTDQAAALPTDVPAVELPVADSTPELSAVVPVAVEAAPTTQPAAAYDPFGGYPDNPYRTVNPAFSEVRKINKDVCGWLTIGDALDTAVVQRDNTYYLNRDYTGHTNVNGAVFLDEQVWLNFRPHAYILYGHNMKTEAMFGMLHRYDQAAYLRANSIIDFNTIYEDGRFAVFASGTVDLQPGSYSFVNYYDLPNGSDALREQIIAGLKRISAFQIPLDVNAQDQILVLVTCTGNDMNRRFVAARRLRSGETAETLSMTYWRMQ